MVCRNSFIKSSLTGLLLGLALTALWLFNPASETPAAGAHGKELGLTVTSLVPDPDAPLRRLYVVRVVYAADSESVEGASVTLSAERQEGGPGVEPIVLTELVSQPGLYAGEVRFLRFGSWNIGVHVTAPFRQGEGQTEFVDKVRPATLAPGEEASLKAEAERVRRLQIFFRFGWWPDVVNIVVRLGHSFSGLGYFGMTGVMLLLAWFGSPRTRPRLAGMLLTGLYSAAFDAPNTAPGSYDLGALLRLPYGEFYLAAFLFKVIGWGVLVFLAFRINSVLSGYVGLRPVAGGVVAEVASDFPSSFRRSMRRLTLATSGVTLLLVVDLTVVIYLHYLTHLGVFLPGA